MYLKRTEKSTEKTIVNRIESKGIWIQKIHSWKIIIAPPKQKRRKMDLADKWTPDILCCIDGRFVSIEVKKDEEKCQDRMKLYHRYIAKTGWEIVVHEQVLPKSYDRQEAQIEHKISIENNNGLHILSWSVWDLMTQLQEHYPHRDRTYKRTRKLAVPGRKAWR